MHRDNTPPRVTRSALRGKSLVTFGMLAAGAAASLLGPSTGSAAAEPMNWEAVAQCESSGNWHANTGNGFYGGLQFKPSTWHEFGGVGSAADASPADQIAVANRVLAVQGTKAWPKCAANQPFAQPSQPPAPGMPQGPMAPPGPITAIVKQILPLLPH